MPDVEVPERTGEKLKTTVAELKSDVAEIKKAVVAILKGIQNLEEETGDPVMPIGTYLGQKFDE